ncbi:VF530 family protein [Tenacibaculum salmonis]|uniref:VF530 family protein n=1 Tax=Tenacibaculum sp. P3-BQ1 TaxID=3232310 RepID=UPI0034DE1888
MDINNNNNQPTDKQQESKFSEDVALKNEENSKEEKPVKRKRRQATQEQLNNPLHGVKLAQILESLVAYYGWEYLGERVNIRCFINNPTMKSSLGFLRRTTWAREHVEDVYLEMLKEKESD